MEISINNLSVVTIPCQDLIIKLRPNNLRFEEDPMNQEFYVETSGTSPDPMFSLFFWGIMIACWLFFSYMQYRIAHKTDQSENAW